MKKIKRIAVLCASIALLAVLCVQAFAAVNNISPNYATNSHDDMSIYYYGYVQCRPSYNEDGQHAQAGYIRYGWINRVVITKRRGHRFFSETFFSLLDSVTPVLFYQQGWFNMVPNKTINSF